MPNSGEKDAARTTSGNRSADWRINNRAEPAATPRLRERIARALINESAKLLKEREKASSQQDTVVEAFETWFWLLSLLAKMGNMRNKVSENPLVETRDL